MRGEWSDRSARMRARVVWSGRGMRFQGRAEEKPWVSVHIPEGTEAPDGPSPMELLLLGAVACTASDVVSILQKRRKKLEAVTVEAEAERAKSSPRVYTRLRLTYRVRGDVDERSAKRAVDLSMEKYCSAMITLERAGAAITSNIQLEPPRT